MPSPSACTSSRRGSALFGRISRKEHRKDTIRSAISRFLRFQISANVFSTSVMRTRQRIIPEFFRKTSAYQATIVRTMS